MTTKRIYNPGFYHSVSNEDYHAAEGLSKSGCDLIEKSPRHYKAAYLDGVQREDTPTFRKGRMVHEAILEPELFNKKYKSIPSDLAGLNKNTNAYKNGLIEFKEVNTGIEIVNPDELEELIAIQASVASHTTAKELLSDGKSELSGFWIDKETGVMCKVRPDFFRNNGTIVDLKTTEDASTNTFERSIVNYRYHVQAAFYGDGMGGMEERPMVFIAVESSAPHLVACHMISPDSLLAGREAYKRNLDTYLECTKSGEWPGYPTTINQIELPHWEIEIE